MFGSHHCQRCDASLPYKGMCEKCATGPAPKEEGNMTDHNSPMLDGPELKKAERRARFERAYMAALGGLCAGGEFGVAPTVANASGFALETVRQWDAMMAELDGGDGIRLP